jgi:hypothetical protein
MSRQQRALKGRHKATKAWMKREGITLADLDEQYRRQLAANPLANRSGGRGRERGTSHTSAA